MTRCLMVLVLGASWACGQPGDHSRSPIEGQPLEVLPTPTLSIGVAEGNEDHVLHDVVRPFLLPDRSVAIPLRSTGEIRIFTPDGNHYRSLGGFGDGPGEFDHLSAAWGRLDTIEAWDLRSSRITRFLPDGGIETFSVGQASPDLARPAGFFGAPDEGWLFGTVISWEMGLRDQVAIFHLRSPEARTPTRITEAPGMLRERMGNMTGPAPLSPALRVALSSAGNEDELYVAQTLSPEIRVYGLDGGLTRTIRWTPEDTPSPRAAFERVVSVATDGRSEPFRARGGIRYPADWVRDASPPDSVPVFSDFLVDPEGFVWIRPFVPERDAVALGGNVSIERSAMGGEWRILSPGGRETGTVRLPDGLEPSQVTGSEILGIHRDELGIESVRIYRLERR